MRIALCWCLALGLALAAFSQAGAATCRKAVVVYVDVSGSMYENRLRSVSPWSGRRTATLMENTVRFLEHRLLNPQAQVLLPGDRLILRGFYRRVDNLIPPVESYDPNQTPPRIRGIDKVLDFNRNGRYDICDARGKNCPPVNNRFLLATDYRAVVRDMVDIFQGVPVGEDKSFARLIFIVLSDGAHDYQAEETGKELEEAVKRAGRLMAPKLREGRVKVVLFRISNTAGKGVVDVGPLFREYLGAKVLSMNPTIYAVSSLRDLFTKDIPRLQIRAARVECLPSREGPQGETILPHLTLQLTVENRGCRPLVLEQVRCRVTPAEPASSAEEGEEKQASESESGREGAAVYFRLAYGRPVSPPREAVELQQELDLNPGAYRLQMVPLTAGLGKGAPVEVGFQLPEAPPNPGTTAFVTALLLMLAGALGVALWWVLSRRSNRRRR